MKEDQYSGETPSKEVSEHLWKIIGRFDFYINTTNSKAAFVIAFNTFIIGSLINYGATWLPYFGGYRWAEVIAALLMFIVIGSGLFSLSQTFLVVTPFLTSNKKTGRYHSSIFFGDVSEYDVETFETKILSETSTERTKDLSRQAHALASSANDKFTKLKSAVKTVIFGELLPLALILILKFVVAIIPILEKADK